MEGSRSILKSPRGSSQPAVVKSSSPTGSRSPSRMGQQLKPHATQAATDEIQQGSNAGGGSTGRSVQEAPQLVLEHTRPADQEQPQQQETENGPSTSTRPTSPTIASSISPRLSAQPFSATKPTNSSMAAGRSAGISLSPLPSTVLPAVGTSEALSSDMLGVLGAWYAMYCPDREAQLQAAVMTHYDPKARFEDNFIQVFGREQIGVQFYGMRRLVKDINIAIEKVEVLKPNGGSTTASPANGVGGMLANLSPKPHSNNTYQIKIILRISFVLPSLIRGPVTSWFLPSAVEAWATDLLEVREADNKIVHHQQRVHNIPVVPWPVRCYMGVSSSLFMMHALGW